LLAQAMIQEAFVLIGEHDVRRMDADAYVQLPLFGEAFVAYRQRLLDGGSYRKGGSGWLKGRKETVTRSFERATALAVEPFTDNPIVVFQQLEGQPFVGLDHAAVADDVGAGETSLFHVGNFVWAEGERNGRGGAAYRGLLSTLP
jgi:hypothetical protein